jgi:hypothetical protein
VTFAATNRPEAKPRAFVLMSLIAIALILVLQPTVSGGEDEDRASAGEWTYLAIVAVADVILIVVIVAAWRRRANPHTGIPGRIRRARARGPLKKRAG